MEVLNDVLGYDNLKIFQNTEFFSFSLDSIILANYSTLRPRDRMIVDFCSGNAIVPLILSKRTKVPITAVEIQKKVFDLAEKSIIYNNLNKQIDIINCDVKDFATNNNEKYDLVLCNPPYFEINSSNAKNLSYEKMIARHEYAINLDELCSCASRVLKTGGNFCLVHRTDRLIDVFKCLDKYKLEPKRIKYIYNDLNSCSNLFLIESQKSGRHGLKIDKPLFIRNLDGSYSDEYNELQREVKL